jgi:hypothetical protein
MRQTQHDQQGSECRKREFGGMLLVPLAAKGFCGCDPTASCREFVQHGFDCDQRATFWY